jgi:hypothetical protein
MAGGQENATSSLPQTDDVAGSRSGKNAVLADQELPDTVGSSNLGDQLNDLRVVEAAITANDEESTLGTLWYGKENGCDESLAVVWLLKDGDLLTKTGPVVYGRVSSWSQKARMTMRPLLG